MQWKSRLRPTAKLGSKSPEDLWVKGPVRLALGDQHGAHLLGQSDHEVAVVALWQLLGQRMAQDLRAAIDATVLQENGTAIWIWQSGQFCGTQRGLTTLAVRRCCGKSPALYLLGVTGDCASAGPGILQSQRRSNGL